MGGKPMPVPASVLGTPASSGGRVVFGPGRGREGTVGASTGTSTDVVTQAQDLREVVNRFLAEVAAA